MVVLNIIFILFLSILGCSGGYNNSMSRSFKGFSCVEDVECLELLGTKSLCIANECQCVPHYHISNLNVCIRDRGLKEFCQGDGDCYWGPEMVDRLECSLGVCACKPGYVPDKGKICVKYFSSSASLSDKLSLLIFSMFSIIIALP